MSWCPTFHCAISVHHISQVTSHQVIVPLQVTHTYISILNLIYLSIAIDLVSHCVYISIPDVIFSSWVSFWFSSSICIQHCLGPLLSPRKRLRCPLPLVFLAYIYNEENGQRQRSQQRGPKAGPEQSWIKEPIPTPHIKVQYSHIPTKPALPR